MAIGRQRWCSKLLSLAKMASFIDRHKLRQVAVVVVFVNRTEEHLINISVWVGFDIDNVAEGND